MRQTPLRSREATHARSGGVFCFRYGHELEGREIARGMRREGGGGFGQPSWKILERAVGGAGSDEWQKDGR